jgi:hypothetical protein
MSKRTIEIDRLEIRLNGVTPESARAAAAGLGGELLGRLARQQGHGDRRTGRIAGLDAGILTLTSSPTPSELRRAIAGRAAASIDSTPRNG